MTEPDRETRSHVCPACQAALRSFQDRLCCDACGGMMMALDDLVAAVSEIVGEDAELKLVHGKPGARTCPRCAQAMATCQLDVAVGDQHPRLPTTLDRCAAHGVWFDTDELASILAALQRSAEPPSHASLREIATTIMENYGHKGALRPRPLRR